jgi:hypothetical protein
LSIGTALSWPDKPAVADAAHFPTRAQITDKLNAQVTGVKRLVWLWTRSLNAWPSTPEGMAAAFDYNRAPFYQSFCEIRVERSSRRVRVIPHGVDGPLRWRDMHTTGAVIPAGKSANDPVEFICPMQ